MTMPDGACFRADTERIRRPNQLDGGIAKGGKSKVVGYALELDSPTAVRTANGLIALGLRRSLRRLVLECRVGRNRRNR